MRKGKVITLGTIAVIILSLIAGIYNHMQNSNATNQLVSMNIEALTQDEGPLSFRYPNKDGDARFCTLYVYIKAGIVVGKSSEEIPEYEASAEYTRTKIEGLKDRCPNKGTGCNPYSCQEVPY